MKNRIKFLNMNEPVTVVTYGIEKKYDTRNEALQFFFEAMRCCEGSEAERYNNVFCKLMDGATYATDD